MRSYQEGYSVVSTLLIIEIYDCKREILPLQQIIISYHQGVPCIVERPELKVKTSFGLKVNMRRQRL
jgi:hypothetical protein